MERLHLEVSDFTAGNISRRTTKLTPDHGGRSIEMFHELDRVIPLADDTPLDGHVLTVFLYAASLGKPLVVHGALSRTALRNMEELALLWSKWRPAQYRRFDIIPERTVDIPRGAGAETAIAAFSGGADATFTALRHGGAAAAADRTRYPLSSLLMVHGFDVDIYNWVDFKKVCARVQPLLTHLGLELRTIRTNSRDLRLQDWEDSASLQLAACLHMHAPDFQYGLIGSTKAYDELDLPCGSCPVTDHLMTGDRFTVVHDGAGFSRTEKVGAIMKSPIACRTLRVCWAGADQSENCGRCEKCVRTQLNFLANGAVHMPPCFPGELDIECIRTIDITSHCQVAELESIVTYAKAHGISGAWRTALEERVAKWQPVDQDIMARRIAGGPLKQTLAHALAHAGVDQPAKRIWRSVRRAVLKGVQQWGKPGQQALPLTPPESPTSPTVQT